MTFSDSETEIAKDTVRCWRPMINSFNISYIRNIRGFPTMNCKISWFGVVRFYISVVQSFDRTKLLSLSTWKIWKREARIVKIWWMFQIYYHIRVGQTTSLQNKINRAPDMESAGTKHIFQVEALNENMNTKLQEICFIFILIF